MRRPFNGLLDLFSSLLKFLFIPFYTYVKYYHIIIIVGQVWEQQRGNGPRREHHDPPLPDLQRLPPRRGKFRASFGVLLELRKQFEAFLSRSFFIFNVFTNYKAICKIRDRFRASLFIAAVNLKLLGGNASSWYNHFSTLSVVVLNYM